MRLPTPFVRLPLRVDADALATEVAALDESMWRPHPSNVPGNSAVPLIAADGDPADDATTGPMRPTPQLGVLPYTVRLLHALDATIGRTRLMRIAEEGQLGAHVDTNYYWWNHLRVHVPVVSAPEVTFECGGERVHMAPGEVWVFDTWRRHLVHNPASVPRIHLVADTVGGAGLWAMIRGEASAMTTVDPGDPAPVSFTTELVNHPAVMSPWELEANLDAVLDDLAVADADGAQRLVDALDPTRRAWRDAWARHGDGAGGWGEFADIRDRADRRVETVAGAASLPNGVAVTEAIRQLVLRPSVALSSAPRVGGVASNPVTEPLVFERPVFVVCPPRSGSSLLFETMARSPALVTIGGESHQVIEALPELHPSAHDWASNRLAADDAAPDVVEALRQSFGRRLVDAEGHAVTHGPVRLLEKTPKNALRVPFLAAAFPDAVFIYLYRDPREAVSSMLDGWRSERFVTYPGLPGWTGSPWSFLLVPGWRDLDGRPLAEVVTRQWAITTEILLDDLAALEPDRWCVASYDRLVADPDAEVAALAAFVGVDGDLDLPEVLPRSRHTLDSPHPEKWRRNAEELEPAWDEARSVAVRAHAVFADPPRIRPVRPRATTPAVARSQPSGEEPFRSVHTPRFAELLDQAASSLAVSTYQSGRVVLVRSDGERLNTHFRSFASPMGMALRSGQLAVGTKTEVQRFQDQPALVGRLDPPNAHDACFVPRHRHITGDIRVHDLAFADDELWLVSSRFSCLATLDASHSFVPRWRPPFVTALAPEDRCHLNGLAIVDDAPRFVTALGTTDGPQGWRDGKLDGGVVLDVPSGEVVVGGLCMPHSPRWHDGRLWVLESGRGGLGVVDLATGRVDDVIRLPGFTRGLAFVGSLAFVGLSQVRESVFDGLPLEAADRQCGVWVVDLRRGETVAQLRFEGDVQEIFDVLLLPGLRRPELIEPGADVLDGAFVLPDAALADVPPAVFDGQRPSRPGTDGAG